MDVVAHHREGKDIVPLVLGETFHGIDMLAEGDMFMRGESPALLTLWLYERLQALGPIPYSHDPWVFASRPQAIDCDQAEWEAWMAKLQMHRINWWISHWKIATRRMDQENSYIVRVSGLFQSFLLYPVFGSSSV